MACGNSFGHSVHPCTRLMHVAMRRRLRLPLPLTALQCGAECRHGCGAEVDAYGDHHLACPHTGLLPQHDSVVERAWVQVAREAVGPEGRVVPQQWLSRTKAPQVHADDRRRLDFVVYGATNNGEALCCDATAKFRKKGCELRELRKLNCVNRFGKMRSGNSFH